MADSSTVVTKKGYFSRIVDSIKGITFGILLIIGAFYLLFWNEGRVDIGDVAVNAIAIDQAVDGDFVYVSGAVSSEENLGDGAYLKPGDYLAVNRTVEMYSWIENSTSKSDTSVGGSETTTTTYNYVNDWTSTPATSSNFNVPAGHENPAKKVADANFKVKNASVAGKSVNMDKLDLPEYKALVLSEDFMDLKGGVLAGGYLYTRPGSDAQPQVGDVRISYSVVHDGMDITAFAELAGDSLVPHVDKETDTTVYRMFDGTRDEALKELHDEYATSLWLFRLLGFILMWLGFGALLAPLSVILDVLPAAGSVSRGLVGLVTFVVSLVLSVLTIFVSVIAHNIYIMGAIAVALLVLAVMYLKKKVVKPNVVRV
ncbi:hypothetical protein COU74_02875 [Candidatus Peregrinibacteria bacterium CG10_big_fil_rev_8_21_14_0_10_36_19]|nr:MAG: hypothetical protein COU74_02875 [Candidatus Peregrinibacteria bacterium CG10_big_fil_rev_8_21_14_0_10_36_19]